MDHFKLVAFLFATLVAVSFAADATFPSSIFDGGVKVTTGPSRNIIKVTVNVSSWLNTATPSYQTAYMNETYDLTTVGLNKSTDVTKITVTYNPSAGYPIFKKPGLTSAAALPAAATAGPNVCLSCFFSFTFTWVADTSAIGSACKVAPGSTDICASATADDAAVNFDPPVEAAGAGPSTAWLYADGTPVVAAAGAAMTAPSVPVPFLGIQKLGQILVPSDAPVSLQGTWQPQPFVASAFGVATAIGFVIPASLMVMSTQSSEAIAGLPQHTVGGMTFPNFGTHVDNKILMVNATIDVGLGSVYGVTVEALPIVGEAKAAPAFARVPIITLFATMAVAAVALM